MSVRKFFPLPSEERIKVMGKEVEGYSLKIIYYKKPVFSEWTK